MKRKTLIIRRIQKDLTQRELTKRELTKRVGISNQSNSDYERGKSNPSYEIMKRISKELDLNANELFFTEN